jgi:hypothetical protein
VPKLLKELECFRLGRGLHDAFIPIGTIGVVLMVHSGEDYEVEFPDGNGGNLGNSTTYTISQDYMEPIAR